jgi:hypothetical protein
MNRWLPNIEPAFVSLLDPVQGRLGSEKKLAIIGPN